LKYHFTTPSDGHQVTNIKVEFLLDLKFSQQWSKNFVFWNITPCSLMKVSRLFGGTHPSPSSRSKINQARNQHEADSKQSNVKAMYSSETSVEFHRVMSQTLELF
jgi:hypothetical protein